MANSNAVQFRGIKTVLKAYENRNAPAWSLWVGKQFLFKYEGSTVADALENLETTLDMIDESASTAIYTLKVYDELPQGARIKEKTESDGSFNFRIQDELPDYSRRGNNNELSSRLAAIEKKINEDPEDDIDEGEQDTLGQINDALEHPLVGKLIHRIFGIDLKPVSPVAISGIPEENQDTRLAAAVEALKKHDPKIATHLEKLAAIADKNINNFNYIISLLEGYQL